MGFGGEPLSCQRRHRLFNQRTPHYAAGSTSFSFVLPDDKGCLAPATVVVAAVLPSAGRGRDRLHAKNPEEPVRDLAVVSSV